MIMMIQLGGADDLGHTVMSPVFFKVMEGMSVQILVANGTVVHTAADREEAQAFVELHGLLMMTTEPRRFKVVRRIVSKVGYDDLSTPSIVAPWVCLQCGAQRGEMHAARAYNGSYRHAVDGWHNPCGHVEKYDAVLAAAMSLDPLAYLD
jgi:hypothetical protein